MVVSFQLTMPNNNSWNGKWTGADKKYYKILTFRGIVAKDFVRNILNGESKNSWYYNFGDGWGARVIAEVIDASESRKRKKASAGFCGYDWMINSIIKHGKILSSEPVTD